jgi:hypothetical protein
MVDVARRSRPSPSPARTQPPAWTVRRVRRLPGSPIRRPGQAPTTTIWPHGVGSYALVVASARIGRIARLPSPTPVMPTPAIAIARRYDHGPRGVHTWVSKGHNRARRGCNSHASQQKPDYELVHCFGPPALSDAGRGRAICADGMSIQGNLQRGDRRYAVPSARFREACTRGTLPLIGTPVPGASDSMTSDTPSRATSRWACLDPRHVRHAGMTLPAGNVRA